MGGWSNERPVSLMSGNGVADAPAGRRHPVARNDKGPEMAQGPAATAPEMVFKVFD
eukprot:gene18062-22829_t